MKDIIRCQGYHKPRRDHRLKPRAKFSVTYRRVPDQPRLLCGVHARPYQMSPDWLVVAL